MLVLTALLAALVFVVTALVRLPVPASAGGGYLNIGDSIISAGALLLGPLPATFAAACGSGIADVASGAALYVVPTVVIKGLMGLIIGLFAHPRRFLLYTSGVALAEILMVLGYGLFDWFAIAPATAWTLLPFNAAQAVVNFVLALLIYKPVLALSGVIGGGE